MDNILTPEEIRQTIQCDRCGKEMRFSYSRSSGLTEASAPIECGRDPNFNPEICWERNFPGRSFNPEN